MKTDQPLALPALALDEDERMRASLTRGVLPIPLIRTPDGTLVDGAHRLRICEELGLEPPPSIVSDRDPVELTLDLQIGRRNQAPETRRALVLALRQRGMSERAIAEKTGTPKTTVRRDLEATGPNGPVDLPTRVNGRDGKSRPAKMPRKEPKTPKEPTAFEAASQRWRELWQEVSRKILGVLNHGGVKACVAGWTRLQMEAALDGVEIALADMTNIRNELKKEIRSAKNRP